MNNRIPRSTLLYQALSPKAKGKYLFALFIGMMLINAYFSWFSGLLSQGQTQLPNGSPILPLDLRSGYTHEEVQVFLGFIGERGRAWYLFTCLVIDMIYPLIYSLFGILLWMFLLQRAFPTWVGTLYKWVFFPTLVGLADVGENLCTALSIWNYPSDNSLLSQVGSLFTQVKWLLLVFFLAVSMVGIVGNLFNWKKLSH
jgi:hypothetical protein